MIKLLNWLSNYLAPRRGLPTLIGLVLIALNFVLQFVPGLGWLTQYDVLLHVGVVLGLAGLMLAVALGG